MKTMIRSVFAVAAVAALAGCGVPKEQHQKLLDEKTALEQKLAQVQQDLASTQSALQQKDADLTTASQQVQSMMSLLRKKQQELDAAKVAKPAVHEKTTGTKSTSKSTSKGKTGKHTTKKSSALSGF